VPLDFIVANSVADSKSVSSLSLTMSTLGGGLAAPPPCALNQHSNHPPAPPGQNHDTSHFDSSGKWVSEGASVVASSIVTSLSHWKIIAFGQFLALLMGLRGSSAALLYLKCNVMAPTFQMACVYVLLSFHLWGLAREQFKDRKTSALAKVHSDMLSHNVDDDNSGVVEDSLQSNKNARAQRRINAAPTIQEAESKGTTQQAGSVSAPDRVPVIDMSLLFQKEKLDAEEAANRQYQYKLPGCPNLILQSPWHRYLILAFLDVEGSVLTCMALKYSSIQSVALLDTLAIPAAMLSSYILLHKRYSAWHLLGASVCVAGASIMVLSDYENAVEVDPNNLTENGDGSSGLINDNEPYNQGLPEAGEEMEYPDAVFGDILASVGGICFGIRDTLAEDTLKVSSRTEYLGMIGLYGLMLSTVQIALFERELVWQLFETSLCSPDATIGMFIAIVLIYAAYYIGTAQFLNVSEAALLNLNLLTSDLYAIMFSIIEEHTLPNQLCGLSMVLILTGVLVYESVPPPAEDVHGQHKPSAFGPKAYKEQPQSSTSTRSKGSNNNGAPHDLQLVLEMSSRDNEASPALQRHGTPSIGDVSESRQSSSFRIT
jgi:solute carrier family 35 protein F1/2